MKSVYNKGYECFNSCIPLQLITVLCFTVRNGFVTVETSTMCLMQTFLLLWHGNPLPIRRTLSCRCTLIRCCCGWSLFSCGQAWRRSTDERENEPLNLNNFKFLVVPSDFSTAKCWRCLSAFNCCSKKNYSETKFKNGSIKFVVSVFSEVSWVALKWNSKMSHFAHKYIECFISTDCVCVCVHVPLTEDTISSFRSSYFSSRRRCSVRRFW